MDEETLKEMIKEQEQIVEHAQAQLDKLYTMANDLGIKLDKTTAMSVPNTAESVKEYIENQRAQIMQRVDKIKEQAMEQAQRVIKSVPTSVGNFNMPNMPNLMGTGTSLPNITENFNIEDMKEKFEQAIKLHNAEEGKDE